MNTAVGASATEQRDNRTTTVTQGLEKETVSSPAASSITSEQHIAQENSVTVHTNQQAWATGDTAACV